MSTNTQRVLTDLIKEDPKIVERTIPSLTKLALDDAKYVSPAIGTLSETLQLIAENKIELNSDLADILSGVEPLVRLVPELAFDLLDPLFALVDHSEAPIRATGLYYAGFLAHLANKDRLRLSLTAKQSLRSDSHSEQIAAYHCLANIGLVEPACLDSVRGILTQSLWPLDFTEQGYNVEDVCSIRRYAAIAIAAQAEAGLGTSDSRRCISSERNNNQVTAARGIERAVKDTELSVSEWGSLSPMTNNSETETALFEALVEAMIDTLSQNPKAQARQSLLCAISAVLPLQEGYAETLASLNSLYRDTPSSSTSSSHGPTRFQKIAVDQLSTHHANTTVSGDELAVEFLERGPYTRTNSIGLPFEYEDKLGIQTFADYSPLITFPDHPQFAGLAHIWIPEEGTVKVHPEVGSSLGLEKGDLVTLDQLSSVPAHEVTLAIPPTVQSLINQFNEERLRGQLRGQPLSESGGMSINVIRQTDETTELFENRFAYSTFLREVPEESIFTMQLPVNSITPTTATRMTRTTTIEFIPPAETSIETSNIQYPEDCDDDFSLFAHSPLQLNTCLCAKLNF